MKFLLVCLSLDNAICKQKQYASIFEMFLVCFFTFNFESFTCLSVFGERCMRTFHLSACLSLKNIEWKWMKFCLLYLNFYQCLFMHQMWSFYLSVCLWRTLYEKIASVFEMFLVSFSLSNVKLLLDCLSLENAICKLENSASIIEMFLVCFFTF